MTSSDVKSKRLLLSALALCGLLAVALGFWNLSLNRKLRELDPPPELSASIRSETRRASPVRVGRRGADPEPGDLSDRPVRRPAAAGPGPERAAVPRAHEMSESMRLAIVNMALEQNARSRLRKLRELGIQVDFDDLLDEDGEMRNPRNIAFMFQAFGDDDLDDLLRWVDGLQDGEARDRAIRSLAMGLSHQNPEKLAAWLWGQSDRDENRQIQQGITRAIQHMIRSDPDKAEAWMERLGADWPQASSIASRLARQRLQDEDLDVDAWLGSLSAGPLRDAVYADIARQVAMEEAPADALYWIQEMQSPDQQANALNPVMNTWSRQDPMAAAAWVGSLDAGPFKDAAIRGLINGLVHLDPKAAALWSAEMESETAQRSAVMQIVSRWAQSAPAEAADWVESLPAGAVRDEAMYRMASSLVPYGYEVAMSWAEGIEDESVRERAEQLIERRIHRGRWSRGSRSYRIEVGGGN